MNKTVDKVLTGVGKAADAAVKTTGDLMHKGKLQLDIKAQQSRLDEIYQKLGAEVYEQLKAGQTDLQTLEPYVKQADKAHARLAALKLRQMQAKVGTDAVKLCPLCGAVLEKEDLFCSGCGAQQ